MGISPFVCVVCSKTGRCARFDGTAPYSPQDSSTPAARRCKPTCRGEQFCFESTTVFIPKKLVSVAPGVKIPLKVKSGLMCVYDGYHHYPEETGVNRKRTRDSGEGEEDEEEEEEEEPSLVSRLSPSVGGGLTSGLFVVGPSKIALVEENRAFFSSQEEADEERKSYRKPYLLVGEVYCRSCYAKTSAHNQPFPVTTFELSPIVKRDATLKREAEELHSHRLDWHLGRLSSYYLNQVSGSIGAWEVEESPEDRASRLLNSKLRAALDKDKDHPDARKECVGMLKKLADGPGFGFIFDHSVWLFFRFKIHVTSPIDQELVEQVISSLRHPSSRVVKKDAGTLPPSAPLHPSSFLRPLSPNDVQFFLNKCLLASAARQGEGAVRSFLRAGAHANYFDPSCQDYHPSAIMCLEPRSSGVKFPPGSVGSLKALVSAGVNPLTHTEYSLLSDPWAPPSASVTPLSYKTTPAAKAAEEGHVEALTYLLECQLLLRGSPALAPLLVIAAEAWKPEACTLLLDAGACLPDVVSVFKAVLFKCSGMLWEEEPLAVIQILVTRCALDVKVTVAEDDKEMSGGRGALWILCAGTCPHQKILQFLLAQGCDPNGGVGGMTLPTPTDTPLSRAIANRAWASVKLLLEAGASLELVEEGLGEVWKKHLEAPEEKKECTVS